MYINMLQYFKNFILVEVTQLVLYTEPDYLVQHRNGLFNITDCFTLHPDRAMRLTLLEHSMAICNNENFSLSLSVQLCKKQHFN